MTYAAYLNGHGSKISYEEGDATRGIIGKLTPASNPVATAETLDELRMKAKAYLAEFPDAVLSLTDEKGLIYGSAKCQEYHDALGKREDIICIIAAILVQCLTCLIGTAIFHSIPSIGIWGLVCFVGSSLLYLGVVKSGFFNGIETAMFCELVLFLIFINLYAINQAKLRRATHTPATQAVQTRESPAQAP